MLSWTFNKKLGFGEEDIDTEEDVVSLFTEVGTVTYEDPNIEFGTPVGNNYLKVDLGVGFFTANKNYKLEVEVEANSIGLPTTDQGTMGLAENDNGTESDVQDIIQLDYTTSGDPDPGFRMFGRSRTVGYSNVASNDVSVATIRKMTAIFDYTGNTIEFLLDDVSQGTIPYISLENVRWFTLGKVNLSESYYVNMDGGIPRAQAWESDDLTFSDSEMVLDAGYNGTNFYANEDIATSTITATSNNISKDSIRETLEPARLVDSYCADFNGSSSYIALDSDITFSHDVDWSIEYYWVAAGNGTERNLMGSTTTTAGYWCFHKLTDQEIYFYPGVGSGYPAVFSSDWIEGDVYRVVASYDSATTTITVAKYNESGGSDDDSDSFDASAFFGATWSFPVDLLGKRGVNDRYFNGDLFNLTIEINGSSYSYPLQGSTYDVSGNDNHGTPTNITWERQDNYHYNIINGCSIYSEFNGASSKIVCPNAGQSQDANGFKYTLSIRTGADITTGQRVIYQDQNAGQSANYASSVLVFNNLIYFYVFTSAGDSVTVAIDTNTYYDIECEYDGTDMILTINGTPTSKTHGTGGAPFSATSNFVIGAREDGSQPYSGYIWDVNILNSSSTTLAHYPLQGSTYDVSGNGNDGTPTNIHWIPVPVLADGSGLADTGLPEILNPANYWHNDCETKFIIGATTYNTTDDAWNVAQEVKDADTDYILHSASTGYGIAQSYDDMVAEQGEYLFMDVSTDNKYKNVLLYKNKQTGTTSVAIHRWIGNGDNLVTYQGQQVYEGDPPNDYPIWEDV